MDAYSTRSSRKTPSLTSYSYLARVPRGISTITLTRSGGAFPRGKSFRFMGSQTNRGQGLVLPRDLDARDAGARGERALRRQQSQARQVVVLAQMREHHMRGRAVELVAQELGQAVVGKMAQARCHPLFQSPGIAAVLEHLEVMVRLEHQAIGAADAVEHMGRK